MHLEHGGIEVIPAPLVRAATSPLAGMNRTLEFMHVVRPQWVVCYLPQGPSLTPDDPRWEQARARLRKATRNYLKVSCRLREEGCEVLWVRSGPQRLDCFPEVREFWKYAQESYGGRAVRCGACWIRCSTSSLLTPERPSSNLMYYHLPLEGPCRQNDGGPTLPGGGDDHDL